MHHDVCVKAFRQSSRKVVVNTTALEHDCEHDVLCELALQHHTALNRGNHESPANNIDNAPPSTHSTTPLTPFTSLFRTGNRNGDASTFLVSILEALTDEAESGEDAATNVAEIWSNNYSSFSTGDFDYDHTAMINVIESVPGLNMIWNDSLQTVGRCLTF